MSPLSRWMDRAKGRPAAPSGPVPGRDTAPLFPTEPTCARVPMAEIVPRREVLVVGEITSVTLRPREETPALEVELVDPTGRVLLIWLGRRRIPGIVPGLTLRVTGRATQHGKSIAIYNPAYEIVTTPGGPQ